MTRNLVAVVFSTFTALAATAAPASAVMGSTGPCAGLIGLAAIPVEKGPHGTVCAAGKGPDEVVASL